MTTEIARAVMKGGSSSFENKGGIGINQADVDRFMGYSCELQASGLVKAVALVASGAVVAGKEYCVERGSDWTAKNSLELARRGTKRQMHHFEIAGDAHGVEVTQVLATNREIDDSVEGQFIKDQILTDMDDGARPVINENPSAAGEETKKLEEAQMEKAAKEDFEPDNSWLAAHVAIAIRAKYLIVLSGVDGFKRLDGSVIEEISVSEIENLLELHRQDKSDSGTGGIDSTMWALDKAVQSGRVEQVIFGNAVRNPRDMILGHCICTRVIQ